MSAEEPGFQERIGRIEALLEEVRRFEDPQAQAIINELVQSLLDLHGTGLTEILQHMMDSSHSGQELIDELAQHELISYLLLLYDLHPLTAEARAEQALERARPYLRSHGGDVVLERITPEGEAQVRLVGTCEGCHASPRTATLVIEEAILSAVPEVSTVHVHGVLPEVSSVSLSLPLVGDSAPPQPGGWMNIGDINAIRADALVSHKVAGRTLVLFGLGEHYYAYGSSCPACEQGLESATLDQSTLTCSHCQHHFDVIHAGRSLGQENLHLEPYALLVEGGTIRVAIS